jgi:hypothetical protein
MADQPASYGPADEPARRAGPTNQQRRWPTNHFTILQG